MIERPRKNRVTPFGDIEATTAKGMFLGNRGDIHAADGGLGKRRWAVKAWICCTLTPKSGNRIAFDHKGTYYSLFFADEATAFAAGHRPCAMCRHQDYQRFKRFWQKAKGVDETAFVAASEIDRELHEARIDAARNPIRFSAALGELPDGVMVTMVDAPGQARLLWRGKCLAWHHSGYQDVVPADHQTVVNVLTPRPLVDVLSAGYSPVIHSSAYDIDSAKN